LPLKALLFTQVLYQENVGACFSQPPFPLQAVRFEGAIFVENSFAGHLKPIFGVQSA